MAEQCLFSNNDNSALAGNITNVATTATITTGSGVLFPAPGTDEYFMATFVDAATGTIREIVKVTDVTGDTITIVRAQEGTSALPWSTGDIFAGLITAGALANFTQPQDLQTQGGNFAVDGGAANAMTITLSPAPNAMTDLNGAGLRIKKSAAANSAAVTLNVNGLGALAVVNPDGSALTSGQLVADGIMSLVYDHTITKFVLQSTGSSVGVTSAQLQKQAGNFAVDTGTANALVVTLSPVPASLAAMVGLPVRITKNVSANTGGVTLNVNGTGVTAITHGDATALVAGELPANGTFTVVYDGTQYVMQSVATGNNTPAIQRQTGNYDATDAGGVNTVVGAFVPAVTAHLPGTPLRVKIANTNTGAVTFDDGAGALAVVDRSGAALTAGAIVAGQIVTFFYETTANKFMIDAARPANTAEAQGGSEAAAYFTPANLKNAIQAVKAAARITVSGGTATLTASAFNVASVNRTSAGVIEVTFGTDPMGTGVCVITPQSAGTPNLVCDYALGAIVAGATVAFQFRALGGAMTDPAGFSLIVV